MEEKDFEALVDMFATDGWDHFTEVVEELETTLTKTAVDAALTNDQWQYARGQIHQLRSILGYEQFVRMSWDQEQQNKLADKEEIESSNVNII